MVDADGVLRNRIEYDSFGNITDEGVPQLEGGGATVEAIDQLFYFTGREFDKDAQLQNNRGRWYDAHLGRFLSEDPAFDDVNLYRYAGNSPLNATDPTGLWTESPLDYLPALNDPSFTYSTGLSATNFNSYYNSSRYSTPSQASSYFRNQELQDSLTNPFYVAPQFTGPTRGGPAWLPNGGITPQYIESGTARREMERVGRKYAEAAVRHGTTGQAFRAEAALAADRLATNAIGTLVEPFAWQVDALTTAAAFGDPTLLNEPAASAMFRAMDARPGSSYLQNVGFVGKEYAKGVGQYQLFESGINYAYDPNLETARAFGDQAGNTGLTAAALASKGVTVRRAPTPSAIVPRPNAQLVQDVATRASAWAARKVITGTPQQIGTAQHIYARDLLNRYQDIFGNRGLSTEVRYVNQQVWQPQSGIPTRGSVILDIVEGPLATPTAIYDYKFGAAGLTPGRLTEIRTVTGFQNTPIFQVRP